MSRGVSFDGWLWKEGQRVHVTLDPWATGVVTRWDLEREALLIACDDGRQRWVPACYVRGIPATEPTRRPLRRAVRALP